MSFARLYRMSMFNFRDYPDKHIGDKDACFKLYKDTDEHHELPEDAVKFLEDVFLYKHSEISAKPDTEVNGYFAIHNEKLQKDYNVYVSAYVTRDGKFERCCSVKEFKDGWVELPGFGEDVLNQLREILQAS